MEEDASTDIKEVEFKDNHEASDHSQISANDPVETGMGALFQFQAFLSHTLNNSEQNMKKMKEDTQYLNQLIESVELELKKQKVVTRRLEESEMEQKLKIDQIFLQLNSVGKNMDNKLQDVAKNINKDIAANRAAARVEIFKVKGNLSSSLNDALENLCDPQRGWKQKNIAEFNPNSSTSETIKNLVEHIQRLENAMDLQNKVCQELANTVQSGNDTMMQKVFDSLSDEISTLANALTEEQQHNVTQHAKLAFDLKEVRDVQIQQEVQISDLRTISKEKLKKLKEMGFSHNREPILSTYDPMYSSQTEDNNETPRDTPTEVSIHPVPTASTSSRRVSHKPSLGELPTTIELVNDNSTEFLALEKEKQKRLSVRLNAAAAASSMVHHGGQRSARTPLSSRVNTTTLPSLVESVHDDQSIASDVVGDDSEPARGRKSVPEERDEEELSSRGPKKLNRAVRTFSGLNGEESRSHSIEAQETPSVEPLAEELDETEEQVPIGKVFDDSQEFVDEDVNMTDFMNGSNRDLLSVESSITSVDLGDESELYRKELAIQRESLDELREDCDKKFVDLEEAMNIVKKILSQLDASMADNGGGLHSSIQRELSELTLKSASMELNHLNGGPHAQKIVSQKSRSPKAVTSHHHEASQQPGVTNQSTSTITTKNVLKVKTLWAKVLKELLFGLENVPSEEAKVEGGPDEGKDGKDGKVDQAIDKLIRPLQQRTESQKKDNPSKFYEKSVQLTNFIEENIEALTLTAKEKTEGDITATGPTVTTPSNNTVTTTMLTALRKIYNEAKDLQEMEEKEKISNGDTIQFTLDDFLCADLTSKMRTFFDTAMAATAPLLDANINKVDLLRRIEILEGQLVEKVDKVMMKAFDQDIRSVVKHKVDHNEFAATCSKHASWTELQKLRDDIYKAIESSNPFADNLPGSNLSDGGADREGEGGGNEGNHRNKVKEILTRFDLLNKHFQDLEKYCEKFVPREEVHEAMKALISEMKLMKKNFVNQAVFKDGLKSKADIDEVERLVKTLSGAISELNIASNSTDFAPTAAAIHARCLTCDKPIIGSRQKGSKASGPRSHINNASLSLMSKSSSAVLPAMSNSTSMNGKGMVALYDKADDIELQSATDSAGKESFFNRLTNPNPAVSTKERTRIVAELAIIRSSIDPLPEITDSVDSQSPSTHNPPNSSGGMSHSSSVHGSSSCRDQYRHRIRGSAGGGMGPSFKQDTR